MARCYAGTVMLEGTTLSEGRGTTRPLELFGAPDLDAARAARDDARARAAAGCAAAGCAPCWFEPTFHKHAGKLCAGLQIHVEDRRYDHDAFRPWRAAWRSRSRRCGTLRPDYPLWRDFPVRVRETPGDRPDQRQPAAARVGRRRGGDARRSRRRGASRRGGLARRAQARAALQVGAASFSSACWPKWRAPARRPADPRWAEPGRRQ